MRLAHTLALANPARVRGTVVQASEFSRWTEENAVYAVPKTIILVGQGERSTAIEGAVTEDFLIRTLKDLIEQGR